MKTDSRYKYVAIKLPPSVYSTLYLCFSESQTHEAINETILEKNCIGQWPLVDVDL